MQLEIHYHPATEDQAKDKPFAGRVQVLNLKQDSGEVEPVLVIRAMQPGAVGMVHMAMEVARDTNYPFECIQDLKALADRMKQWQGKHGYVYPPSEVTGKVDRPAARPAVQVHEMREKPAAAAETAPTPKPKRGKKA